MSSHGLNGTISRLPRQVDMVTVYALAWPVTAPAIAGHSSPDTTHPARAARPAAISVGTSGRSDLTRHRHQSATTVTAAIGTAMGLGSPSSSASDIAQSHRSLLNARRNSVRRAIAMASV